MITDFYKSSIGNVKKLVPNFSDKEKYVSIRKLPTLSITRIKNKTNHRVLEFDQSQWLKPYVEFNRIEYNINNRI